MGRAKTGAIKQRSPEGARWAVTRTHQIEKMHHGECSILGRGATWVKLLTVETPRHFCIRQTGSSALEDFKQLFPCKPSFPQQRNQRAIRDISVALGNHSAAFRTRMVIAEVPPGTVVEH